MGPGPGARGDGGRRVWLDGAQADESLNEGEAPTQSCHRDVTPILTALLCEGGDQVVGHEFQLRSRVVSRKLC
jgi:hypothetical protein